MTGVKDAAINKMDTRSIFPELVVHQGRNVRPVIIINDNKDSGRGYIGYLWRHRVWGCNLT